MASESADKSMCFFAEGFYVRRGAASQGTLFSPQLMINRVFLCLKCAGNFWCGKREEDPEWLHFSLSEFRWQVASA